MVGNGVFMSEFGLGEGRSDSARETAIVARQSKKERERAWQLFTYARFLWKGLPSQRHAPQGISFFAVFDGNNIWNDR